MGHQGVEEMPQTGQGPGPWRNCRRGISSMKRQARPGETRGSCGIQGFGKPTRELISVSNGRMA